MADTTTPPHRRNIPYKLRPTGSCSVAQPPYLPDTYFTARWNPKRTGKIYATRVYKSAYSTASAVPAAQAKLYDNAGLRHACSTDTVEGVDDYADIHVFQWQNCNYIRDNDSSPRITALEGQTKYRTRGDVDVGVCGPTFYWNVTDDMSDLDANGNPKYQLWIISDSPHPELGLVPWCESVRADGTVAPYWCHSKYISGRGSDGLPHSQPGLPPIFNVSYDNMITNYQKKGPGYWGGGVSVQTFGILFDIIKNATKHLQSNHTGYTQTFDRRSGGTGDNYPNAITRDEELSTFPVSATNAEYLQVGLAVHIGTTTGWTGNDIRSGVVITGKEPVYDEDGNIKYVNIILDCAPFAIPAKRYMMPQAWIAGTTDSVIGHHDGSPVSNTDYSHAYRIQGTEYNVGILGVYSDFVRLQNSSSSYYYIAKKGTPHDTSFTGYKRLVDSLKQGGCILDIDVDKETGAYWPTAIGTNYTVGYRAAFGYYAQNNPFSLTYGDKTGIYAYARYGLAYMSNFQRWIGVAQMAARD